MRDDLDSVGADLGEARAKIVAAREALRPLLDNPAGLAAVGRIAARLDRMAAEVAMFEVLLRGQAAEAR
jgi:hypothetical protein